MLAATRIRGVSWTQHGICPSSRRTEPPEIDETSAATPGNANETGRPHDPSRCAVGDCPGEHVETNPAGSSMRKILETALFVAIAAASGSALAVVIVDDALPTHRS